MRRSTTQYPGTYTVHVLSRLTQRTYTYGASPAINQVKSTSPAFVVLSVLASAGPDLVGAGMLGLRTTASHCV
eukprot:scaffold7876_cov417-Prasinococcus_capsulatus_cf.AAC.3